VDDPAAARADELAAAADELLERLDTPPVPPRPPSRRPHPRVLALAAGVVLALAATAAAVLVGLR
jgi:alkanesulfonate monooxygenase SsuD/methylene tetrahydromethanopterin reductase-like flavin-dependent oxidoreductase (luciferase family)